MLQINTVLKFENALYRIIYVDGDTVVWISIESSSALPKFQSAVKLEQMLLQEQMTLAEDPFASLVLSEPEEGSTSWEKRERAWSVIEKIVADRQGVQKESRTRLIGEILDQKIMSKPSMYKFLRRYWQRGLCKNALIPDYKNSGGRGKQRKVKTKPLGRPRIISSGHSIPITTDVERIFRMAIETIYLKKSASFAAAYRKVINLFRAYNPDANEVQYPTKTQLKYFLQREYENTDIVRRRMGELIYNKDVRPLHGTATANVLGPGSRYEIDATIADVYLVSNANPDKIVGRPVIYIVIDVFSRMVTGLYVGLDQPSYVAAMLALANAADDKVEYCKKYNIDIVKSDWPVKGLPDAIMADRGELQGHQISSLISAFNVRIENAPPYRGDAKGIVERYFKTVQDQFKPFVPGVVTGKIGKKRAGNDYRLDAVLTLDDFTQMIIQCVLWHNNNHQISRYDPDADIPEDLPLVPCELWNWGVQNRTGRLRQFPIDVIRTNLLPRVQATVSSYGIKLFGGFYSCSEAIKMGWFERIGNKRPSKVTAAYDPRQTDRVFVFPYSDQSEYWVCSLTERSRRYQGISFWEMWQRTKREAKSRSVNEVKSVFAQSELDAEIESIVNNAIDRKGGKPQKSKAARLRGIRDNRKLEAERTMTPLSNEISTPQKKADVIQFNKDRKTTTSDFEFPKMTNMLFEEEDNE